MYWLRGWRIAQWALTLSLAAGSAIAGLLAMVVWSEAIWDAGEWGASSGSLVRWAVLAAGVTLPPIAVGLAMAWRWRWPRTAAAAAGAASVRR